MKAVYYSLIRKKVINEVNRIGDGICEIIIDIELSFGTCNTIELEDGTDNIFIHVFEENDFDIFYDFDALDLLDKLEIYKALKTI